MNDEPIKGCQGPCGSIDCSHGCIDKKPWTGSKADSNEMIDWIAKNTARDTPQQPQPMATYMRGQEFRGGAPVMPGTIEQPRPEANSHPAVWPLVMVDMAQRDNLGRERYGTPLQPHNGRDMLADLYQELLDAAVYIRAVIYERDGK